MFFNLKVMDLKEAGVRFMDFNASMLATAVAKGIMFSNGSSILVNAISQERLLKY